MGCPMSTNILNFHKLGTFRTIETQWWHTGVSSNPTCDMKLQRVQPKLQIISHQQYIVVFQLNDTMAFAE